MSARGGVDRKGGARQVASHLGVKVYKGGRWCYSRWIHLELVKYSKDITTTTNNYTIEKCQEKVVKLVLLLRHPNLDLLRLV